jgi:hypothetical protein
MKKEKTLAGKILKTILPIIINIVLKKHKFNKTSQDEKRIDDFTNNL